MVSWLKSAEFKQTTRWILLSGLIAFFVLVAPLIFGLVYYGQDLSWVDVPFICELKNHLAAKDGFYISRYFGNGEPLFANPQSQLFYPIRWIQILFFSSDFAPSVGNVIHWSIGAAGTTALALSFGVEGLFACIAGLFFVFSGTVLNLGEHTTYMLGAAWLPWIWASGRRTLAARRVDPHFFALVGTAALCLIGGEPLGFFMGFLCLSVECLLALRRREVKSVAQVAGAYAMAMLLCSVQWIPSLSELRIGVHGVGHLVQASLDWGMELPHWFAMVLPDFAAKMVQGGGTVMKLLGSFEGLAKHNSDWNWNMKPYLGFLFICFAAASVFARQSRSLLFIIVFGAILAIGVHTPILPFLLEHVPPFSHFRYPQKYFLLFNLAACVLGAMSFQRSKTDSEYRHKLGFVLCGGLVVLISVAAWSYFGADSINEWSEGIAKKLEHYEANAGEPLADVILHSLLTPIATTAAAVLLLLSKSRVYRLLPWVALLDLMILIPSHLSFSPSFTQAKSPLTQLKPHHIPGEPVYCFSRKLYEIRVSYEGEASDERWGQYFSTKLIDMPNLNACDRLISGSPYSVLASPYREELEIGVSKNRVSAARALGCTHIMTSDLPQEKDVRAVDVPAFGQLMQKFGSGPGLYLVDDPVPLVFVAKSAHTFTDPHDWIGGVSQSRTSAEILSWVDDPVGSNAQGKLPDGKGVQDLRVQWAGEALAQVDVQGTGAAVLGVRSTYAVGWEAYQAGTRLPTVRVAGSFIGAIVADVAAGSIEFRYSPPHLGLGAMLSALTLLFLLAIYWYSKRSEDHSV